MDPSGLKSCSNCLGAMNSSKQSYRILTFFPSLRIRSCITYRPDLDITKDWAIRWRRSQTHPKTRIGQYIRSQGQHHLTVSSLPAKFKTPLRQKYLTLFYPSRGPSVLKNTKGRWTSQTTQPMGRPFHRRQGHQTRNIGADNQRRDTS
jgi:hypothetical protein